MDTQFLLILFPAALADSINPCAFAILFIILSSILSKTGSREKTLLTGLAFTFAIFMSYYLMGIGLYKAFAFSWQFFYLQLWAGILATLIGLGNMKDYFFPEKFFRMEMPQSFRIKSRGLIQLITSPLGAFVVGILISLFLLPCTWWPYLTVLTYLASESPTLQLQGYVYLLIYNLIFILPFLIINFLVYFGTSDIAELKEYREYYTREIHLIVWVLMFGLGLYILWDIFWF